MPADWLVVTRPLAFSTFSPDRRSGANIRGEFQIGDQLKVIATFDRIACVAVEPKLVGGMRLLVKADKLEESTEVL